MGRSTLLAKYEITPEIQELQKLVSKLQPIGHNISVDITQDLVTFNGFRKMNRADAKIEMLRLIESAKNSLSTADFPDPEEEARKAKEEAKRLKKQREPGAPPELKTLIRRAKRIYKKTVIKTSNRATASVKAQDYIHRKATEENIGEALQALLDFEAKEQ